MKRMASLVALLTAIFAATLFMTVCMRNFQTEKITDMTTANEQYQTQQTVVRAKKYVSETRKEVPNETTTEPETTEATITMTMVPETTTQKSEVPKTTKEQKTEPELESENIEIETEPTTESEYEEVTKSSSQHGELIGNFLITGYTAEEGFGYGSGTASGIGCKPGTCAMNNSRREELGIKYGDEIYVEGVGYLTVTNCGCNYNVIDIWFYTNQEASDITSHRNVYFA